MATQSNSKQASQVNGVASRNKRAQSTHTVANDQIAWLAQATKVRDEALRLMRERFSKDLEDVRLFVSCNAPNAFTLQVEYATKLTADYLAESERMFELISKLARDGLLEHAST